MGERNDTTEQTVIGLRERKKIKARLSIERAALEHEDGAARDGVAQRAACVVQRAHGAALTAQ